MLTKEKILEIINQELSTSDYSSFNGSGQLNLETSLQYYLGLPNGTEIQGRSKVTSTDVADSIEWIMPQIMKSFTQNNEIVEFDPVHEGDEKQALLESQYVYEVLMKQNDGFIVLHQFVKDALMQKNGILKVYYAKRNCVKLNKWTGITEEQLLQLAGADGVEIISKSSYIDTDLTKEKVEGLSAQLKMALDSGQQLDPKVIEAVQKEINKPVILYDVELSITRTVGKIYVDPVPPEEFRVNNFHNSISLENARFTAHVMDKPVTEVIEDYNISFEEAEELPEAFEDYTKLYRFSMQNENVIFSANSSSDPAERMLTLAECFMRIDIDETGYSKLMKITTAGGDEAKEIVHIEEIEDMPWISTTAILMSHKFYGLSITDRLKEIQDQKTALWRNMFDNLYLQNNQRTIVVESQVNMSDLLVSRPGGVIRAKRIDALAPVTTPLIGQAANDMMSYLDRVRAGRVGVDPDGNATPQNIGDRVGSQGVDRLLNAKEELVGLIIRVIAETGIKPLCIKIRNLAIKHTDAVVDFRFRGQWHKIEPNKWMDRTSCTVRVGTGTGNHLAQITAITQVLGLQEKILAQPSQTLLTPARVFSTLDDFCRFSGLNGANKYFVDPDSDEGKKLSENVSKQTSEAQAKQDALQAMVVKAQNDLANAELEKSKAQLLATQYKNQIDVVKNQLTLLKDSSEADIKALQHHLEEVNALSSEQERALRLQLDKYKTDLDAAIKLTKIEADSKKDESANLDSNMDDIDNEGSNDESE